ncbi:crotonobetainyl-CoA:carnitine CoA-transferase CaiB-like acyl-CoA transferase [Bradyrhizobium algeriense]|uniref:Crotonobetainyl-CoA:carnitine CoA-transferase CaiB-like acyl-CoA transferase n=1 Tax=Bradyrhizobium algeriense TaxID=634784 RepID=A0ABU8BGC2_9BRAD
MSILQGLRVVEIAGLGPGPFCGMLLADLGADVIVVERKDATTPLPRPDYIVNRGKRSIALDLKQPQAIEVVLRLVERADALIEGMRPGVMERLGLAPEVCLEHRPSLIYGRMTGWGQYGPLSHSAGHDGNYAALSGALWYSSPPGIAPVAPPTLIGDVGGGALYLAIGLLAGVLKAKQSGCGQVVDAAIVDGSAHMLNLLLSALAANDAGYQRGVHHFDCGPSVNTYRCSDGGWVVVSPLETKFYEELLKRIGLAGNPIFENRTDAADWPLQRAVLSETFAKRTRAEWCAILEGTDACFAPVNDPAEAARHPHMAARQVFAEVCGVLQAAPAPRFSQTAPTDWRRGVPRIGQDTETILRETGYDDGSMRELRSSGAI